MGSCVSTHSPNSASAVGAPKQIPAMSSSSSSSSSSSWTKNRRDKKKRKRAKDNEAKGNDGPSDRRPAICSAGVGLAEEELHRVHGRLFLNGASEVACLYTQQGKKGTNQDAMLVWENFTSRNDTIFCGVFDGHGPFGHMVAKKVRDSLPLKLSSQWSGKISGQNSPYPNGFDHATMDSEETMSTSIDDEWGKSLDADLNEKSSELYLTLRQSLLRAFKLMDKELKLHPSIDCFCSGCTAVTVIKQGEDLVIGNVGDSRAILGTRDKDDDLVAVQLTVDLKPNLPREAARIHKCNGRVFALQDEPEVARVWLPNNDSPGLAMARAFGDFCLKDYGLISVPDVSYRHLTEKDEFIVLATDGVWDALSNKEVVDIIATAPTRGTAARALVDCAVRSWHLKFPKSKIDDCAAICLFLEPPSAEHQALENDTYESPEVPAEDISAGSIHQKETIKEEVSESATNEIQTSSSVHSCNVLDTNEIVLAVEPKQDGLPERSKSIRSLADCISTSEEEEWSALEGVTRVNSLLSLPRFLSSEKRSTRRKWL